MRRVRQQLQWAAQRKFVCYRYGRNTSQYSTFNTPTDWFCNAAVHLDNGNLLIVGGTAIDGYPNTNGGKWSGTPRPTPMRRPRVR